MKKCIADVTFKTGDIKRYKFKYADEEYFIKNKYIKGVNVHNDRNGIINTDSISIIEFVDCW